MAVYKVIQDIEAEDKLLGPLTLKQFIFGAIACGFGFVGFMVASSTTIFAFTPFVLPILIFGILAAPLGKDQPTDIWLAAQIRFRLKPRKRIWDQSGLKNLVTITAPKKIEKILTDGLSQQEVRSRLKALAETIDSHGWATKNADINLFSAPDHALALDSDRLIDPTSLPQVVPDTDVSAADDIMDVSSNMVAQHFDVMVKESAEAHKQAAIDRMHRVMQNNVGLPPQPPQTAQTQLPPDAVMFKAQLVAPHQDTTTKDSFVEAQAVKQYSAEELELLKEIAAKKRQAELSAHLMAPHHRTVKTPEEIAAEEAAARVQKEQQKPQAQAVTPQEKAAIVNLANTNEFSVQTIANLANRKGQNNDGEVVINLH